MTATTATTTTTIPRHRPALPLISLLAAGAAATLGVVAIVTDDVTAPAKPAVVQQDAAQPVPVGPAIEQVSGQKPAGDCLTRALIVRC